MWARLAKFVEAIPSDLSTAAANNDHRCEANARATRTAPERHWQCHSLVVKVVVKSEESGKEERGNRKPKSKF